MTLPYAELVELFLTLVVLLSSVDPVAGFADIAHVVVGTAHVMVIAVGARQSAWRMMLFALDGMLLTVMGYADTHVSARIACVGLIALDVLCLADHKPTRQ